MWTILLKTYKYKTYYCANVANNVCVCVVDLLNSNGESNTVLLNNS